MKTIYIVAGVAINMIEVSEAEANELLKLINAFETYEEAYWFARAEDL